MVAVMVRVGCFKKDPPFSGLKSRSRNCEGGFRPASPLGARGKVRKVDQAAEAGEQVPAAVAFRFFSALRALAALAVNSSASCQRPSSRKSAALRA